MPKIAISYRRRDTEAITGRIFDRLVEHYGRDAIFLDIDNIPPGIDFRAHITDALTHCDILLAIVGPNWAGRSGRARRARIDDENDFVRIEVETALQRGISVIPVLVGSSKMPSADQVPEGLKEFAYRQAVLVDPGRDFEHHVDRLTRELDRIFSRTSKAALEPQTEARLQPAVVPREGEVVVDCAKVRKLILQECGLSRAGAEKRMNITHAVWHRMLGGPKTKEKSYAIVKEINANVVVTLAQEILQTTPKVSLREILVDEISPSPVPKQAKEASFPVSFFGQERRIALVDDDRTVLLSVSMTLEGEGFHVVTYPDGASALQGLTSDPVDLVLLDVRMPQLGGLDVLQKLRLSSSVPVIMLTSNNEEVDELMALRLGADDYVTKPFSSRRLIERIRTLLRRRVTDEPVMGTRRDETQTEIKRRSQK
jgi:CheY-like chemotaxis protein